MWSSYDYTHYSGFDWDVFWSIFVGGMSVAGVIALVFYIFQSIGLYTVAKRRKTGKAWMAWVPFLNTYLLGKVSDQYQSYTQGRKTHRGRALLICSILAILLLIPYMLMLVKLLGEVFGWVKENYPWGEGYAWRGDPPVEMATGFGLLSLAIMAVAIVAMVFEFMSLYDLFRSCDPKNATVFLLICIFVNFTMPFMVFAVRKKDGGMVTPAQRQQAWQAEQAWRAQQWQAQQAWQAQQWQAQQAWQAQQQQQWQAQQAQQQQQWQAFQQWQAEQAQKQDSNDQQQ